MRRKKGRILFGAVDVGWRIEHYSEFINKNYSERLIPESVVFFKVSEKQYKTNYTYEYNLQNKFFVNRWIIHFFVFLKSVFKYDIFYFISGETLLPRKLRRIELEIYKLLNKKIIFHFVGSDIRSPKYIDWKTKNIQSFLKGNINNEKLEKWQKRLVSDAEKYADKIYVSTPDLLQLVSNAEYIPVFIDINKFNIEIEDAGIIDKKDDVIYILHAPSNRRLKGSEYIERILTKMKKENNYKIELLLPKERGESTYSISRYELFKMYKKADIVIDQMIIGWYGLQAIEALLARNIVISYIDKVLENNLFDNYPINIANINTLEDVIINSIKEIKIKTRDFDVQTRWVNEYHTIENSKFFNDINYLIE